MRETRPEGGVPAGRADVHAQRRPPPRSGWIGDAKAGVVTPVSACASGTEGIAKAWRNIVLGEADIAICGGVETRIEAVPIAAFAQMRIVMSTTNDDPAGACRPFDRDRNGFVFGEGGALMVIETEEHAKARGAKILAALMGAGITSDGYPHRGARSQRRTGRSRDDAGHRAGGPAARRHRPRQRARHRHLRRRRRRGQGHQQRAGRPPPRGVRTEVRAGPLGRRGRRGGVDPDRAGAAGRRRPAHAEPARISIPRSIWTWSPGNRVPGDYEYAINNSFGFGGHNVALAFGKY